MKTRPSSIEEIRQRTRNLIEDHEKSIRQFHEKHFPHLCASEAKMTDENFTGVRATTADEEAVMFRKSWIKAERENAALREENARLRAALKPFADILEKHGGFEKVAIDVAILYAAAAAIREVGKDETL